MKKEILIGTIALGLLAACGEESGSESSTNDAHQNDSVNNAQNDTQNNQPIEQDPKFDWGVEEFVLFEVNEDNTGYQHSLNHVISGNLDLNDEFDTFGIRFEDATEAVIVLEIPAGADFDLLLWNAETEQTLENTFSIESKEVILFNFEANVDYKITVEAYSGTGDYKLALALPERKLLQLAETANLYSVDYQYTGSCTLGNETETINQTFSEFLVLDIEQLIAGDYRYFFYEDHDGYEFYNVTELSETEYQLDKNYLSQTDTSHYAAQEFGTFELGQIYQASIQRSVQINDGTNLTECEITKNLVNADRIL